MKKISKNEQLFNAVEDWNIEEAKKLLKAGAKANLKYKKSWQYGGYTGYEGKSILEMCYNNTEQMFLDMYTLLLENGADPKHDTSIFAATHYGYLKVVKLLVKYGADIHQLNSKRFNENILQFIDFSKENSLEMLKYFLNKGVDAKAIDDRGKNCLFNISEDNHLQHAQLLIDAGADVNQKEKFTNCNVLHNIVTISHNNFTKILQFLIDAGADTNAWDSDEKSPLIAASKYGNIDAINVLLNNGVDVNQQYKDKETRGKTALMIALEWRNIKIAELLRDKGANPNLVSGKTAFYYTQHNKDLENIINKTNKIL